jgi:hypothetical protein
MKRPFSKLLTDVWIDLLREVRILSDAGGAVA